MAHQRSDPSTRHWRWRRPPLTARPARSVEQALDTALEFLEPKEAPAEGRFVGVVAQVHAADAADAAAADAGGTWESHHVLAAPRPGLRLLLVRGAAAAAAEEPPKTSRTAVPPGLAWERRERTESALLPLAAAPPPDSPRSPCSPRSPRSPVAFADEPAAWAATPAAPTPSDSLQEWEWDLLAADADAGTASASPPSPQLLQRRFAELLAEAEEEDEAPAAEAFSAEGASTSFASDGLGLPEEEAPAFAAEADAGEEEGLLLAPGVPRPASGSGGEPRAGGLRTAEIVELFDLIRGVEDGCRAQLGALEGRVAALDAQLRGAEALARQVSGSPTNARSPSRSEPNSRTLTPKQNARLEAHVRVLSRVLSGEVRMYAAEQGEGLIAAVAGERYVDAAWAPSPAAADAPDAAASPAEALAEARIELKAAYGVIDALTAELRGRFQRAGSGAARDAAASALLREVLEMSRLAETALLTTTEIVDRDAAP